MVRLPALLLCASLAVSSALGCRRAEVKKTAEPGRESTSAKETTTLRTIPGSLPPDCAVAVSLDPAALGPAIELVGSMIHGGVARTGRILGIDPKRDVRRIRGCNMSTKGGKRYVVLMSGRIPGNLIEHALSDTSTGLKADILEGIPIAAGPTAWIARRNGNDGGEGELVLASDRELLRATLGGSSTAYRLDPEAPFSAVLSATELQRIVAAKAAPEDTGLARIREVVAILEPGAHVITLRAVVGDATVSEKLGESFKPVLSEIVAGLVGPGQTVPEVTAKVDSGDLVLRAELTAGTWTAVATRLMPRLSNQGRAAP